MSEIKADLSKGTIADFLDLISGDTIRIVKACDHIIEGGVFTRPLTQLPEIFTAIIKAIKEQGDLIDIAVGSLRHHWEDDND